MKQLIKPEPNLLRLISQSDIAENDEFKLSQYVLKFEIEGRVLYFNTLTKECYIMDQNEVLPDETYGSFLNETNKDLIERRFYVKKDTDETASYCNLLSLLRTMDQYRGIKSYVILPTTYCNARCFYCYEQDYHFVSMSEETVDKLIPFIEKTHADKEITFNWFGGEPLLGKNVIRKVCTSLKEKGISFKSSIVTNSSLFSESLIDEAKELWNLNHVQITLDGDEEEYNRRKNYFDMSVSPFLKVIKNICLLHDAGIDLYIRLNVDYQNIESMKKLAERLKDQLQDKSNILIYAHPLFSLQAGESCVDIWEKCIELEKLFEEYGFTIPEGRGLSKFKRYYCMTDNPSHIVINADGSLYGCEHCQKETCIGSLDEIPVKPIKKTVAVSDIQEKCRHCAFLPECTDFSICPDIAYDCKGMRFVKLKTTLKQKLNQDS